MDGTSSGMTGFAAACHDDAEEKRGEAWNPGSFGKDMACADREKDKIRTGQ